MKRFVSVITVISIILMSVTVFASDVSDKTSEILASVKPRIAETSEYEDFYSDVYENENGTMYNFSWYGNNKPMSLSVDENGIITYYRVNDYDEEVKATINKKTTDEMLPFAKALLKKLNPEISDSLKVINNNKYEDIRNRGYSYYIQRYENGIPVKDNDGYITISADGSEIKYFNLSYNSNLSFAEKAVLSKEDAEKAFYKNFGMELNYDVYYEDGKPIPYLLYIPRGNYGEYISAVDGEVVSPIYPYSYTYGGGSRNSKAEMAEDAKYGVEFTPAELEEIENLQNVISKTKADEIARGNKVINIPKDLELKSANLNTSYSDDKKYYYNLYYYNDNDEDYRYCHVTLDAVTGDILSFYKDSKYDEEKKLTDEEAIKIADNAKVVLLPKCNDEYRIDGDCENGYVNYRRYINDILYKGNWININVDMATGEVVGFNYEYEELDFPSPEGIISEETACEKLFESTDYSLAYIPTCSDASKKQYDKTILVYRLEDYYNEIDAFTGELKNQYNEDLIPEYTDIDGHYGENAITTLRKFCIGFDEPEFRPDDVMTKRDFTAIALSALKWNDGVIIYRNFDYDNTKRQAGSFNIEDADSDSPVTREDAAVIMIKILGFDEVASLEGIYNCPFPDVTEHKGHISILNGMNVINGDENGNFNPTATLSRADGAILIYNYLNK